LLPLKALRSWWWNITHPPIKPPKTLDLLCKHLKLLTQHYIDVKGEAKPLDVRKRYKLSIASEKRRIEEVGFRAPKNLQEAEELRSWVIGGSRYGE